MRGVLRRRSTAGCTGSRAGPRWTCWTRNGPGCTRSRRSRTRSRSGRPGRSPANTPMVSFEGGRTRCRTSLLGETVWVRVHGAGGDEQVVIVHVGAAAPVEVARHDRAKPGSPQIDDAHFPPAPAGALNREPKAAERRGGRVPALGDGAALWLKEAAAQGTSRIRVKMAHAVRSAKLTNPERGRLGAWARRRARPLRRGATWPRSWTTTPDRQPQRPRLTRRGGQLPHPGHRRVGRDSAHQVTTARDDNRRAPRRSRAAAGRGADRAAAAGRRGRPAPPAAAAAPAPPPPRCSPPPARNAGNPSRSCGPVHRGGRRPGPLLAGHPPGRGRVPDREDVPRLEHPSVLDPGTDPAGAAHPGMGAPQGEPRRLRPVRDREDVPARSARAARRRDKGCTSPGSPWKTSAG